MILCGDFNTQLSPCDSVVGQYTNAGERAEDAPRATFVLGLLQSLHLRAVSTFADTSPTRRPWPSAKRKGECDSTIDFICATDNLVGGIGSPQGFPLTISSDHSPLWLQVLAPYKDKRKRRRLMEHLLRHRNPNSLDSFCRLGARQ